MGATHYQIYQDIPDATVVEVFDYEPEKLKRGEVATGNIGDTGMKLDFTGVKITDNLGELIESDNTEVIDICLPTYVHSEYTIKALKAGKHVLCEKPMALRVEDCDAMLSAAEESQKKLMIAQCVRFWPEYALTKKLLNEERYGEVLSAFFKRLSPTPTWSYGGWLLNEEKSGGALVDLHIHDIDYIVYLFGKPNEVSSFGRKNLLNSSSGVDYIVTRYIYDRPYMVIAEGGWHLHSPFPFNMSFTIRCEKATIWFDSAQQRTLAIFEEDGSTEYPEIPKTTGWEEEIKYFVNCVANNRIVEISPPEESKLALEIAFAEKSSIERNIPVKIL